MRAGRAAALWILLGAALANAAEPPAAAAPANAEAAASAAPLKHVGRPLLGAAERAPLVVVGKVAARSEVDASAYAAQLTDVRVVAGPAVSGDLRVVWEELASGRPPRWSDGDVVLVALEEAPTASLWQKRFPAEGPRWTIAAGGNAYLPDADERSVASLGAFLALSPPLRNSPQGAAALAHIVATAHMALRESALQRLRRTRLPEDGSVTGTLMRVAFGAAHPGDLHRAILAMAGRGMLPSARVWLNTFVDRRGALEAEAYAAIGELEGGLPQDQVAMLLDRDGADLRAVGARFAKADLAERRLPELVRSDPAAEVRATAAVAAAQSATSWGLAAALPALADGDPIVRAAAIQAIAKLGAPAVAPLAAEVDKDGAGAASAITALSLMGEPGRSTLQRIAHSHAKENLRSLALLALGEVKDEHSK